MGTVQEVDTRSFQREVLEHPGLVLVDFSAPWCAPCRFIDPLIDNIAEGFAGRVKFARVNTDGSQDLAIRYRVRMLPSLLLFRAGEVLDRQIGAGSRDKIIQFVEKHLAGAPAPLAP